MVLVQSRWQWDIPVRQPSPRGMPDIESWAELAGPLSDGLEALVIEAMRHALNECGYAGTNPYECPHVADAMDAAFTAAEQALPPGN